MEVGLANVAAAGATQGNPASRKRHAHLVWGLVVVNPQSVRGKKAVEFTVHTLFLAPSVEDLHRGSWTPFSYISGVPQPHCMHMWGHLASAQQLLQPDFGQSKMPNV